MTGKAIDKRAESRSLRGGASTVFLGSLVRRRKEDIQRPSLTWHRLGYKVIGLVD